MDVVENVERRSTHTERKLSFTILILAVLVSGYLSYLKLSHEPAVCIEGGAFDCGVVLNSAYSELAGIPIAWLGLATNLIAMTLLLIENRSAFTSRYGPVFVLGVVLFAFLYSIYLVYIQAFRLLAFCPWCLTHEALIIVLFILSSWRLYHHMKYFWDA